MRVPASRPATATPWVLAGAVLGLLGSLALVRWDIAHRRDAFQTDARIVHRLLSQRAVELEATLATLSLLAPPPVAAASAADPAALRLPALHPALLEVLRRPAAGAWPPSQHGAIAAELEAAEVRSRAQGHAAIAAVDAERGRYTVVLAAAAGSDAFVVDVERWVPWPDWPLARGGPVAVRLAWGGTALVVEPGSGAAERPAGLTPGFVFAKELDAPGQPFRVEVQRATGPAQWPWAALVVLNLALAALLAAAATWQRQRRARLQAEQRLRLAQASRLNVLGEMAAGLAHELNQPLAAVLANAQALRRDLQELQTARPAAANASAASAGAAEAATDADDAAEVLQRAQAANAAVIEQARRAGDVVQRLRRRLQAPPATEPPGGERFALPEAVAEVVGWLQDEARRRDAVLELVPVEATPPLEVQADRIAVQQIVHNLALNALQALDGRAERRLHRRVRLALHADGGGIRLEVADSGPGIAPEQRAQLFQPFASARPGGLGLGLVLCETLAMQVGGRVRAAETPSPLGGAQFELWLPRAGAAPSPPAAASAP